MKKIKFPNFNYTIIRIIKNNSKTLNNKFQEYHLNEHYQ